jgi:glycosyltransferase involved in cell wall biosynthesis
MLADWSRGIEKSKVKLHNSPYVFNWVMSPPSGGGGHQNIFRFISLLDRLGHKNNIYLYSTYDDTTIEQVKENVKSYSSANNLTFMRYEGVMTPADVIFATGWETAYPVFNIKSDAHKMYFVQDFEPMFYPMSTDYILAENTYKFGFRGITAGGWLDKKLSTDYGMKTDHYDFGANKENYKFTNQKKRKEVFFYARPVTERRAFDLGIMALEIFHSKMPDYTINLAGWDVSEWDVPFPYVNLKAMEINELSAVYNRCAVALVLSLTNMSLLPLELLAAGTIPVVNDGENNRLVSNNPYIAYTDASPESLAKKMIQIVTMKDLSRYAKRAADSVPSDGWDKAGKKFMEIIEDELTHV